MSLDFLQPVVDFFNFVGSLLTTISEGITGVISIVSSIINLIINITRILPSPLYPCFLSFLVIYNTIFIYKLFRQG